MNRNMLHQTLIRAARTERVHDGVPSGFEARVMAAVRRIEPEESLRHWASVLGKAAFSSAAVAAVVCLMAMIVGHGNGGPGVARDPGSAVESIHGAGDEIAGVLIEGLESGESW
jgi:hypothetical protein